MFKAALIGRTNVGKSTLFNRLISENKAVVSKIAGTTRDTNYGQVEWDGKIFELIDTAGLDIKQKDKLEQDVLKQAKLAQEKADLIMLVIDIRDELLSQDKDLIKKLRQNKNKKQPVFLVVNKADSLKLKQEALKYQGLDFDEVISVSAISGKGTDELLDKVIRLLPKKSSMPKKSDDAVRVCLIGKPNAGKSSIFNKIINQEKALVSPLPHTTRDAQDTELEYQGQKIILIDTAGYRRKLRTKADLIERLSVEKAVESLKRADVAFLILDISQPLSSQDARLAQLIRQNDCGLIVIGNKIDLADDTDKTDSVIFKKQARDYIGKNFPYLAWAPVEIVSAIDSKKRAWIGLLKKVLAVHKEMNRQIAQDDLTEFISQAVKAHRPSRGKGVHHPRVISFTQVETSPLVFEMQIKSNTNLHGSYLGFLEKKLRQKFGFEGAPLWIKVKRGC